MKRLAAAFAFVLTGVLTVGAQVAKIYTSTADGRRALELSSIKSAAATAETNAISLDPAQKFQSMDGFGYAITYSACYNLLHMNKSDRESFLRKTFSVVDGYGASYVRISIGCNDFSSCEYSLCEKPGLKNFALYIDETQYVIPVLKEILAINPKVRIIAAPWTCPKWMKVDDLESMKPHDKWTDGHLNPKYRRDYAEYFVRFVKAMKKEGIKIYAVSPQNEPLNRGNCASLYMPWDEEALFVKEMAGAFKRAKLKTLIYLFDHNYNYDNIASQSDYPIHIYRELGTDYEGHELVVGAAYHNYGGNKDELLDIYSKAPDKELIFTETSIGTWNDGRNLSRRLIEDMREVGLGTVNRMCRAVLVWNLMLDEKRGPNLDGGCQTCYGAVDINSANYRDITLNSHYYVISHLACAVRPGAWRIATKGEVPKGVSLAAFQNPDGTCAVVAMNEVGEKATLPIEKDGKLFNVELPARSVVSVIF